MRQSPLQSLHGLLQWQGELEACAGGGVDVQIHGGFSRDGLAGRSPATGAASGAGMLVHPITCAQRRGETRRAEPGSEKGEKNSEADPSLPLQSLDLLANQRQHSERSLSLFFFFLLVPPFFLSLSESQNKTQSVVSPVNIMRISPEEI